MSIKTWKIIKRQCENLGFREKLLQGVNLIMLHSFVRDSKRTISNYCDPETSAQDKEWFENEIARLTEMLATGCSYMTPEQMKLLAPDRQYPYGWLIFIPEE